MGLWHDRKFEIRREIETWQELYTRYSAPEYIYLKHVFWNSFDSGKHLILAVMLILDITYSKQKRF